ncbi:MAG: hypothetical protein PHC28_10330 [Flavobacterium sp.]|uniref:hypothetical protein n=1 Tax=Flavobacterium sp. TaxID=239 RepID=UPI00262F4689|nr:hypothetical protein [Flavobacterium sp.]MDD5150854.1 hypothetical protein [Flavobacterium sp.]
MKRFNGVMVDSCTIAIVKGIKEENDSSFHFGSLGSFKYYLETAIELGFVTKGTVLVEDELTELGEQLYFEANLKDLPKSWHSFWDHDKYYDK